MTNKTYQAHDFFQLTSRIITPEGYLVAPGAIARVGGQEYRAHELGLDKDLGMDPMRVVRLHRPAEEVFNTESMASFENKPVTIDHPRDPVTAENWSKLAHGEVRDIVTNGQFMQGTVIIKSKAAVESVMNGKVQLSNGYTFALDLTPGTDANGQQYDGVQRNIRGNHIALVDNARCGSACRIADSTLSTTGDSTMNKVIVDGIPLEVSDTAAAAINKLLNQIKEATDGLAAANTKLAASVTKEAHDAALAAKDAEIQTLKKDVMTPAQRDAMVADWSKMIGDAKVLAPEVTTEGKTCLAIRREVVTTVTGKDAKAKAAADAVLAGKTIDAADADTVRAVFNVLVATRSTEAPNTNSANDAAQVAAALAGKTTEGADAKAPVLSGRDAMIARQQNAWQSNGQK
jgi:hypothetical protein